jgi:hypothetical protein
MEVEVDLGYQINYLAVLVSAVAYMILGAIWYSPAIFGKVWMRAIGKTADQVKADSSAMNYVWAIIAAFIASYGVARIMEYVGSASIALGVEIGLVAGVCFVFASFWMNDTFEARSSSLTFGNALYHLLALILAGIIIGAWG